MPQTSDETPTIPVNTRSAKGGKVGRRVLLATAGVVACGGLAALTPVIASDLRQFTEAELKAAVAAAENNARLALLKDLANLEGVSIDVAITAAQVTQLGVRYIVLPVANVVAALGVGALGVLIGTIDNVESAFKTFHLTYPAQLDALKTMLTSWQTNLGVLPVDLGAYANADIASAEAYLTSLKTRITDAQSQQPQPTPTPGVI